MDAAEETLGQGSEGRFLNDRRDCTFGALGRPLGCLRAARWLPGRSRDGGHATLHFRAVPSTIGLLGATVSADIRDGTIQKFISEAWRVT